MRSKTNKKGFSLAEILMSLGILSIGMLLIAAVFPAGIHFTTIATERTIASSVADEAFAKIRMYCTATDPCIPVELEPFPIPEIHLSEDEFAYPSDPNIDLSYKQYSWSALCRRMSDRNIQVTVFVSRRAAAGTRYYEVGFGYLIEDSLWPEPVFVTVSPDGSNRIIVEDSSKDNFINPGCTIVDETDGRIYRVLDRVQEKENVVSLDGAWLGETTGTTEVWVIPPPVGGGRYPCIAVYQKVIRF